MNEASGARSDSHGANSLADNNTVDSALGLRGNAASFVTANLEYFSIADNPSLSTGDIDFTLSANVYLNNTSTTMIIANKGDKANVYARDYTLFYDSAASKFAIRVGNGTTNATVFSSTTVSAGQWYTVIAWHDSVNNTLNIQVNNGSASMASYSSGAMDTTYAMSIGAFADGTFGMNGRIDEVALYKRVLTSAERTWLYNSGAGRTYADLAVPQAAWQTKTYTYSATIPHAVTALMNGQSTQAMYEYDANGNTLAPHCVCCSAGVTCRVEDGKIYKQTYNAENRIASIQKLRTGACADLNPPLETKWDFAYDGDGTRTATLTTPFNASGQPQTAALTLYYFGGAYEVTGSAVKKYYSFGGQTIMRDANGLKYMLTDHLGSVVAITDSNGTLTSQQRYLPFGAERTNVPSINPSSTDYGYTGQRKLDSGMGGLMDYKARFYSPYINHFLQPDSLIPDPSNPQAWNRYSYVENNPIGYSDPTGHMRVDDGGSGGASCGGPGQQSCLGNSSSGNNGDPDEDLEDGLPVYGPRDQTSPDILGYTPPTFRTLHPVDGNVLSQQMIYDYSYIPPKPIGYRLISYAYDKSHFSSWNLFVPSDPITFSSTFADIAKGLLKPMVPGVEFATPGVGEGLTVAAALDSLNSAITFDTHLRTHDIYFTESPFDTPNRIFDKLLYQRLP